MILVGNIITRFYQGGRKMNDTKLTFREWLDKNFYPGFDVCSLSDEEYYELEDKWRSENED